VDLVSDSYYLVTVKWRCVSSSGVPMAVILHGSLNENIELILQRGFIPGDGLHHWLGFGVYGFAVCSDASRGPSVAYDNATAFAKKKYSKGVGCVSVTIDTQHCLDLQHPEIIAELPKFDATFDERLRSIGLKLEADGDWVRPHAHFRIDALCLCISALSSNPIHVIKAQFSEHSDSHIEKIINPELCIKNPIAILNVKKIRGFEDIPAETDRSNDWIPSNAVLRAVKEANIFIRGLSESAFADLVFKIAEGANCGWCPQNRFPSTRDVPLVVTEATSLAGDLQRAWQSVPFNNLAKTVVRTKSFKELSGPEAFRKIDELVGQSNGLMIAADGPDVILSSILMRAKSYNRPVLVIAIKDIPLPCECRSMRNVTVFEAKPKKQRQQQLEAVLTGFMTDNWKVDSQQACMRLMLAARGCSRDSNPSKIEHITNTRNILEAINRRWPPEQQLPYLIEMENGGLLENLSLDPEVAAQELRNRLKILRPAISRAEMLSALAPFKTIAVNMSASGYLIPKGLIRPFNIIAVKESDASVRQRFTIAHEIGHAILNFAKVRPQLDEEQFCDEFASAFLMPENLISEFSRNIISLGDWLDLPRKFDVSNTAALRRAWKCEKKLLVFSSRNAIEMPLKPSETRQLLKLGENLREGTEDRGKLFDQIPYIVRRSKDRIEAVADFAVSTYLTAEGLPDLLDKIRL